MAYSIKLPSAPLSAAVSIEAVEDRPIGSARRPSSQYSEYNIHSLSALPSMLWYPLVKAYTTIYIIP